MRCQWRECEREATEVVMGGLFEPTRIVCPPCRADIVKIAPRPLLPRMWWPPKGSHNTSRRWEYAGRDWKPLPR